MQPTIKVAFTDFWHGNSARDIAANPLYKLLSRYYHLELSRHPDFLIYSCFGKKYLRYNCTRIFFTGENIRPDFAQCDYAFSFDYPVTERNYRLPLYYLYQHMDEIRHRDRQVSRPKNRKFCNFVYSNKKASERIEFFKKLSQYKSIDSGGKVMNNVGGRVRDKLAFLSAYKFTIAFENSSYPGYITEKILEALVAGTLPIYWGNPMAARDFNPQCFINCHDFEDFDAVIDHVSNVDRDDDLYHQYMTAPIFSNGVDNEFINEENLRKQFDRIFSGAVKSQVAARYDRLKYYLHPSRPGSFARSMARRWRQHRWRSGS